MTRLHSIFAWMLFALALSARADQTAPRQELVVSVAEQRMALIQDGQIVKVFPISTSRYGIGDNYGSYKTPVGHLRICGKLGNGLPEGAVIRRHCATGEVLPVNAPGRDPIVTRILCLQGTDASTAHAEERHIYIHGTPEERFLGRPVSFGCIRMRSKDVVEIYNTVAVGTPVTITSQKLQRTHGSFLPLFLADLRTGSEATFSSRPEQPIASSAKRAD